MAAKLQVKPENCSPLGRVLLQHMKEHNVSMNELAKQANISQPGLRSVCLGTNPTDATLLKLAQVLGKPALELYNLAHAGRIEEIHAKVDCSSLDTFTREILETAQELGLEAPKSKPAKEIIQEALRVLGFSSSQ